MILLKILPLLDPSAAKYATKYLISLNILLWCVVTHSFRRHKYYGKYILNIFKQLASNLIVVSAMKRG